MTIDSLPRLPIFRDFVASLPEFEPGSPVPKAEDIKNDVSGRNHRLKTFFIGDYH